MFLLFMALLFIAGIFIAPKFIPQQAGFVRIIARVSCALIALFLLASTSYVYVDADEVGHLKKVYGGSSLEQGRIIAANGEKGYQAEILAPGFHVRPLISVFYDVEMMPVVTVPAGFYGRIEARDGAPLPADAIVAQPWADGDVANMLDAAHFLNNGGQRGLQTTVLKPSKYRLNLYLFKVTVANGQKAVVYDLEGEREIDTGLNTEQTIIPAGHVGVVTSRLAEDGKVCRVIAKTAEVEVTETEGETTAAQPAKVDDSEKLSVPLVPVGCKGIWETALRPGGYFLQRDVYDVTVVDTRVQTWKYKGGFNKRSIALKVNQDGSFEQTESSEAIEFDPQEYADKAINVKVEGWDVPQEVRVVVQVTPENAPIVVAAVGGLQEVEDRILTPAIRSIARNVVGSTITYFDPEAVSGIGGEVTRPTRVLDLIENRQILEANIERLAKVEGAKAGVNVKEVRFGEPAIPPELLVARQREQLSQQLALAFQEEKKAQDERIKTENAKGLADKQADLAAAEVDVDISEKRIAEKDNLGQAEKNFLTQVAEGERARANVLGEDRVMMLTITDKVLATLAENPELVQIVGKLVPNTVVTGGDSGGLAGAAAIFKDAFSQGDKKQQ